MEAVPRMLLMAMLDGSAPVAAEYTPSPRVCCALAFDATPNTPEKLVFICDTTNCERLALAPADAVLEITPM